MPVHMREFNGVIELSFDTPAEAAEYARLASASGIKVVGPGVPWSEFKTFIRSRRDEAGRRAVAFLNRLSDSRWIGWEDMSGAIGGPKLAHGAFCCVAKNLRKHGIPPDDVVIYDRIARLFKAGRLMETWRP